jgi:hypothetical protein
MTADISKRSDTAAKPGPFYLKLFDLVRLRNDVFKIDVIVVELSRPPAGVGGYANAGAGAPWFLERRKFD